MKHLLSILVLICTCKFLIGQSVSEPPQSYSYFTIGITDGDIFNGLSGLGKITDPIVDKGPGLSPYFPRHEIKLSADFTRIHGKHSMGLSYLTVHDAFAGIRFNTLDLDYGYQVLHSQHISVSAEAGLMYGNIMGGSRAAVKLGLRSYTKLYKNFYLYATLTGYHKFSEFNTGHRGSLMLTTGLSYRFTEKSQQANPELSRSDTP